MSEILSERLRAARKAVMPEITQRDVAKLLGRSSSAVNLWEARKGEPSAEHIVQLARLYKVSCDWLLGATDSIESLGRSTIYTVPVVTPEELLLGDITKAKARVQTIEPYPRGAAVEVDSDALASVAPRGCLAVVQADQAPSIGAVVMAQLPGTPRPIIRRLADDAGQLLLMADDQRWPTHIVSQDTRLVGVVREVISRRVL